jgi:ubiquinone/menaquinone biosynthesis C-methylase UbiE
MLLSTSALSTGQPPPKPSASPGTAFAAAPLRAPKGKQDRLARVYDEQVHPLVGARLSDLLLRGAELRPRSAVLELGCASGASTMQIARRLDGESRVVALDAWPALLDLARTRFRTDETLAKRVFFRGHPTGTKLPFAEETFETVLANMPFDEVPDPAATIADLARVARPGGQLVIATPLRGTWVEFLDLYREVLISAARLEGLGALASYVDALPEGDRVAGLLEDAGLYNVRIDIESWELVFRSAREFFYSPVIEQGPLNRWKELVDREVMHETFVDIKEAIDTYFAGRAFSVTILAGRFSALKK